jgi:hypothetical protein
MATRTELITYGSFENPTGLPVGAIVVTFTATNVPTNSVVQSVPPGTTSVTQVLNADTYVITAQAVDTSTPPANIGKPVSETVIIPVSVTPTLVVLIPTTIVGSTSV